MFDPTFPGGLLFTGALFGLVAFMCGILGGPVFLAIGGVAPAGLSAV